MPKIIKDAKSCILENARDILLSCGYEEFSMRMVAERSSVAVGTIYNYFPKKMSLISEIMNEDWNAMIQQMHEMIMKSEDYQQGVLDMCKCLMNYCSVYRGCWYEFLRSNELPESLTDYHPILVNQIKEQFDQLNRHHRIKVDEQISYTICEIMLILATSNRISEDDLNRLIGHLYHGKSS